MAGNQGRTDFADDAGNARHGYVEPCDEQFRESFDEPLDAYAGYAYG